MNSLYFHLNYTATILVEQWETTGTWGKIYNEDTTLNYWIASSKPSKSCVKVVT